MIARATSKVEKAFSGTQRSGNCGEKLCGVADGSWTPVRQDGACQRTVLQILRCGCSRGHAKRPPERTPWAQVERFSWRHGESATAASLRKSKRGSALRADQTIQVPQGV